MLQMLTAYSVDTRWDSLLPLIHLEPKTSLTSIENHAVAKNLYWDDLAIRPIKKVVYGTHTVRSDRYHTKEADNECEPP